MSEMVERVAEAIRLRAIERGHPVHPAMVRHMAAAAIEAMREPTIKMISAAQYAVEAREARFVKPDPIKLMTCKMAWQTMIDEALK